MKFNPFPYTKRGVYRVFVIATLLMLAAIFWFCSDASGAVPHDAKQYKRTLVRAAHYTFGLNAPVATLAAQVHQESRWQHDAKSYVGAEGLAQFMPKTSVWMAEIYPSTLGDAQPYNPAWALRAMVQYDQWLHTRIQARSPCDKWAMILAAYNGGLTWLRRDKKLAQASGVCLAITWKKLQPVNAGRSAGNFNENRHYVRIILTQWEPMYSRAGWGRGACGGAL